MPSFQNFSFIIEKLSNLFPIFIRVNQCAKLIFTGTPRLDPGMFISLQQLVNAILVKHEYPLIIESIKTVCPSKIKSVGINIGD